MIPFIDEGVCRVAEDYVRLRLRFKDLEDLPAGEGMWGLPVDAHDGGGTYRLLNSSFMVPLAAGDTVRASIDGRGGLQIVDIIEPCDRVLTVTAYSERVDPDEAQRIADAWTEDTDGWTEGTHGLLYTTWPEGMRLPEIDAVLRLSIGHLPDWNWHATAQPADRERWQHHEVDFELDLEAPPVHETDYWAPDDPVWAELGITDVETLAYLQRLAGEDPRVAATLKNGKHDNVLRYIERLSAEDPWSLPVLEEPLLDEA